MSEKDVWAGAEVIQEAGGLTGIGIGVIELSINWSDIIPQSTAPGESFLVYVSIFEYDDDPGSRCGIKFSSSASAKAYATRDTTDYMFQAKSKAFAEIDTSYGELDLGGPRLIKP
ncbi:MAG: hypothetical protein IT365_01345 [Candidatus Hydrogenedentes bacterium]|nr:hypothetical protein [Candidatus Hydrogenedentota bacterium]